MTPVTVSHDAVELAVIVQLPSTDTVTVPVDASRPSRSASGVAAYVHVAGAAPAWVTVMERPPAVTVADREEEDGFAVARKSIVAAPVPESAPLMLNQPADVEAVQAHPSGADSEALPSEASAGSVPVSSVSVYEQGAAACVIVRLAPPAEIAPVRGEPPVVLAATA